MASTARQKFCWSVVNCGVFAISAPPALRLELQSDSFQGSTRYRKSIPKRFPRLCLASTCRRRSDAGSTKPCACLKASFRLAPTLPLPRDRSLVWDDRRLRTGDGAIGACTVKGIVA